MEEGICSEEGDVLNGDDADPDYRSLYFWGYGNRRTLFCQASEAAGIPKDDLIAQREALENRDEWVVAFFEEMRAEFNRLRLRRAIKEIADVARWGQFGLEDNISMGSVNQLLLICKTLVERIDEPGMLVNEVQAAEEESNAAD